MKNNILNLFTKTAAVIMGAFVMNACMTNNKKKTQDLDIINIETIKVNKSDIWYFDAVGYVENELYVDSPILDQLEKEDPETRNDSLINQLIRNNIKYDFAYLRLNFEKNIASIRTFSNDKSGELKKNPDLNINFEIKDLSEQFKANGLETAQLAYYTRKKQRKEMGL